MSEKKLYEKPVLDYCGKMMEQTMERMVCLGSCGTYIGEDPQ
jgi:hypothetical protein